MDKNSPILIVGAGPVGLSLAVALIQKGIHVRIFEKLPQLSDEIRASTLHPPTLEMLAKWGVIDGVLEHGFIVRQLCYWERATRQKIAQFNYDAIAADTPYPYRLQCPQHILTRVLKPYIEKSPLATIHMGHELLSFEDEGDSVTATVVTEDGEKGYRGRYLVGADGAGSLVRRQLGLNFAGMTYADRFLLIGTDYDFSRMFPGFGPVNYIFDPQEWVIILRLPDLARVVFRLRDDEDEAQAMKMPALQARMWRFIGEQTPFNIVTTQLYRVHRRVAETFRVGNLILAGDAAHINNPAGGMGMNSGIHDANNLADKLARIGKGESEKLLDSYSDERKQAALASVQSYSDKNYKELTATDEAFRKTRDKALRANAADPAKARAYLLAASMLSERI